MHSAENVSMRRGSVFFFNYTHSFVLSMSGHKYNVTKDRKFLYEYRWMFCKFCTAVCKEN